MPSNHPPEPSPSAPPRPRPRAGIPARFRDGGATLADSEDSPTVKEKKQKVKKIKKSVDSSDDVSAATAAPAAARPAAEPAFLCAHPDCSGLPHRGCPGQSGLGSRRTQLEHVKEIHGGTPEAFVSCGVAPPRKKRTRDEVQAEKAAKAVEKAEKKAEKKAKEAKAVLAKEAKEAKGAAPRLGSLSSARALVRYQEECAPLSASGTSAFDTCI